MLQGSPSRCNWGILWDSPIIRWDRSICWIIRVVVKGSFGILRDSWGILEEFLRNLLEIGDWKLIKPFSPACDGILEDFMKIFNCFSTFFFLSFSFTSSFCAFTSAVVEFYLFIFFLCCHQDVVDWDSLMILYGDSLRDQSNATSLKVLIALWLDYCAALSVLFMTRSPRGHNTPTSHLTMLTRHVT